MIIMHNAHCPQQINYLSVFSPFAVLDLGLGLDNKSRKDLLKVQDNVVCEPHGDGDAYKINKILLFSVVNVRRCSISGLFLVNRAHIFSSFP